MHAIPEIVFWQAELDVTFRGLAQTAITAGIECLQLNKDLALSLMSRSGSRERGYNLDWILYNIQDIIPFAKDYLHVLKSYVAPPY